MLAFRAGEFSPRRSQCKGFTYDVTACFQAEAGAGKTSSNKELKLSRSDIRVVLPPILRSGPHASVMTWSYASTNL